MSSVRFAFLFVFALTVMTKYLSSATSNSFSESPDCVNQPCTDSGWCEPPCTCQTIYINLMRRGICTWNQGNNGTPPAPRNLYQ
uniref:Putative defensin n=1 Tax=Rhipicephalus microplus TaxID=6941 RepID=A0A6G5A223_RHIMP